MIDLAPRVDAIRALYPSLHRPGKTHTSCIYFDAPGGTQTPKPVIDAMCEYLQRYNCNTHGQFATSQETDAMIQKARIAAADFLGAPGPETIHFGANMSTMAFHLSHAIGYGLKPGDEIIVTHLDHDANISPWLMLERFGIRIKWLDFNPEDCTLRLEQLPNLLGPRTRLVAAGYASNAVGTINEVKKIIALTHQAGAWAFIDAVHFAPHGEIDVQAIDCDFLLCSAYKFFGPHLGIAYVKPKVAESLAADRVRPQDPHPPEKFETGTLNHEGLAGLIATVDYLADLAAPTADEAEDYTNAGRRRRLQRSMRAVSEYERKLTLQLITGLQSIPQVRIHGITEPDHLARRTPTVSITVAGRHPSALARELGNNDIFVWDGDFFAGEVIRGLGLEERGGLLRIGLTHYNTAAEIDRFLETLNSIVKHAD